MHTGDSDNKYDAHEWPRAESHAAPTNSNTSHDQSVQELSTEQNKTQEEAPHKDHVSASDTDFSTSPDTQLHDMFMQTCLDT